MGIASGAPADPGWHPLAQQNDPHRAQRLDLNAQEWRGGRLRVPPDAGTPTRTAGTVAPPRRTNGLQSTKSIKLGPGLRLTASKSGIGLSAGTRGARYVASAG